MEEKTKGSIDFLWDDNPIDVTMHKPIDLSMNENKTATKVFVRQTQTEQSCYPSNAPKLVSQIGNQYNLPFNRVFLTNGIDDAIDIFLRYILKTGKKLLIDVPNYYGILQALDSLEIPTDVVTQNGLVYNAELTIRHINSTNVGAIYLCNPRNPIGDIIPKIEKVLAVCEQHNILVFIDEAYMEYSSRKPHYIHTDNLVVAKTFSKAYGLAGCRIGYILSYSDEFANYLGALHKAFPYRVSANSVKSAYKALNNLHRLHHCISRMQLNKSKIYRLFDKYGVDYVKSETNFVCFKCDSVDVCNYMKRHNILIRNTDSAQIDGFCRVTIGNRRQTAMFVKLMKKYLTTRGESNV